MVFTCLAPFIPVEATNVPAISPHTLVELHRTALQAYHKEDYATVHALVQPGVAVGHPPALDLDGRLHFWGLGVRRNHTRAAESWAKAANKGDRCSTLKFAAVLESGIPLEGGTGKERIRRATSLKEYASAQHHIETETVYAQLRTKFGDTISGPEAWKQATWETNRKCPPYLLYQMPSWLGEWRQMLEYMADKHVCLPKRRWDGLI